jgi:hypothetical protein
VVEDDNHGEDLPSDNEPNPLAASGSSRCMLVDLRSEEAEEEIKDDEEGEGEDNYGYDWEDPNEVDEEDNDKEHEDDLGDDDDLGYGNM